MPAVHSQPAKVAIVSSSVQSLSGQEALRCFRQFGLVDCSVIDLRSVFPMSEDEAAVIASPNLGSMDQTLEIERLVYRHHDFVGTVYSCVANSASMQKAASLTSSVDPRSRCCNVSRSRKTAI